MIFIAYVTTEDTRTGERHTEERMVHDCRNEGHARAMAFRMYGRPRDPDTRLIRIEVKHIYEVLPIEEATVATITKPDGTRPGAMVSSSHGRTHGGGNGETAGRGGTGQRLHGRVRTGASGVQ